MKFLPIQSAVFTMVVGNEGNGLIAVDSDSRQRKKTRTLLDLVVLSLADSRLFRCPLPPAAIREGTWPDFGVFSWVGRDEISNRAAYSTLSVSFLLAIEIVEDLLNVEVVFMLDCLQLLEHILRELAENDLVRPNLLVDAVHERVGEELVPVYPVLLRDPEALLDESLGVLRYRLVVGKAQWLVLDVVNEAVDVSARPGSRPEQHHVVHHPDRPDVALRAVVLVQQQLRRHEQRSSWEAQERRERGGWKNLLRKNSK